MAVTHQIDDLVIELSFQTRAGARRTMEEIQEWLERELLPELDELLTRYSPGRETLRIDNLTLDCGVTTRTNFRKVIQKRLFDELERVVPPKLFALTPEISFALASDTAPEEAAAQQLLGFLQSGQLPWHRRETNDELHGQLFDSIATRPQLANLLQPALRSAPALRRLVRQFSEARLTRVLASLAPNLLPLAIALQDLFDLSELPRRIGRAARNAIHEAQWTGLLNMGFTRQGAAPDAATLAGLLREWLSPAHAQPEMLAAALVAPVTRSGWAEAGTAHRTLAEAVLRLAGRAHEPASEVSGESAAPQTAHESSQSGDALQRARNDAVFEQPQPADIAAVPERRPDPPATPPPLAPLAASPAADTTPSTVRAADAPQHADTATSADTPHARHEETRSIEPARMLREALDAHDIPFLVLHWETLRRTLEPATLANEVSSRMRDPDFRARFVAHAPDFLLLDLFAPLQPAVAAALRVLPGSVAPALWRWIRQSAQARARAQSSTPRGKRVPATATQTAARDATDVSPSVPPDIAEQMPADFRQALWSALFSENFAQSYDSPQLDAIVTRLLVATAPALLADAPHLQLRWLAAVAVDQDLADNELQRTLVTGEDSERAVDQRRDQQQTPSRAAADVEPAGEEIRDTAATVHDDISALLPQLPQGRSRRVRANAARSARRARSRVLQSALSRVASASSQPFTTAELAAIAAALLERADTRTPALGAERVTAVLERVARMRTPRYYLQRLLQAAVEGDERAAVELFARIEAGDDTAAANDAAPGTRAAGSAREEAPRTESKSVIDAATSPATIASVVARLRVQPAALMSIDADTAGWQRLLHQFLRTEPGIGETLAEAMESALNARAQAAGDAQRLYRRAVANLLRGRQPLTGIAPVPAVGSRSTPPASATTQSEAGRTQLFEEGPVARPSVAAAPAPIASAADRGLSPADITQRDADTVTPARAMHDGPGEAGTTSAEPPGLAEGESAVRLHRSTAEADLVSMREPVTGAAAREQAPAAPTRDEAGERRPSVQAHDAASGPTPSTRVRDETNGPTPPAQTRGEADERTQPVQTRDDTSAQAPAVQHYEAVNEQQFFRRPGDHPREHARASADRLVAAQTGDEPGLPAPTATHAETTEPASTHADAFAGSDAMEDSGEDTPFGATTIELDTFPLDSLPELCIALGTGSATVYRLHGTETSWLGLLQVYTGEVLGQDPVVRTELLAAIRRHAQRAANRERYYQNVLACLVAQVPLDLEELESADTPPALADVPEYVETHAGDAAAASADDTVAGSTIARRVGAMADVEIARSDSADSTRRSDTGDMSTSGAHVVEPVGSEAEAGPQKKPPPASRRAPDTDVSPAGTDSSTGTATAGTEPEALAADTQPPALQAQEADRDRNPWLVAVTLLTRDTLSADERHALARVIATIPAETQPVRLRGWMKLLADTRLHRGWTAHVPRAQLAQLVRHAAGALPDLARKDLQILESTDTPLSVATELYAAFTTARRRARASSQAPRTAEEPPQNRPAETQTPHRDEPQRTPQPHATAPRDTPEPPRVQQAKRADASPDDVATGYAATAAHTAAAASAAPGARTTDITVIEALHAAAIELAQLLAQPALAPQAQQQLKRIVDGILNQRDAGLLREWRKALGGARVQQGLARHVPAHVLERLVQQLAPEAWPKLEAAARAVVQALGLVVPDARSFAIEQAKWQFLLERALAPGTTRADADPLTELAQALAAVAGIADTAHLLQLVERRRLALAAQNPGVQAAPAARADVLRFPGQDTGAVDSELEREVHLDNVGLVLAAPYIPRLFAMLNVTVGGKFPDHAAQERGVHLLQYIVTGQEYTPEYKLLLNKVLCGILPGFPVCAGIDMRQQEKDTIEQLLLSMIQHWKILGGTSVAGLRQTFLQRQGWLRQDENGWQLEVKPGSFDMLLDQLPWGYSLIKFAWMDKPMHVSWRNRKN